MAPKFLHYNFFFQFLKPQINAKTLSKTAKTASFSKRSSRKFVRFDRQRTLIKEEGSSKLFLGPSKTRKKKYPKNDGSLPGEPNDFDDLFREIWDKEWTRNLLTMALEQVRLHVLQKKPVREIVRKLRSARPRCTWRSDGSANGSPRPPSGWRKSTTPGLSNSPRLSEGEGVSSCY